MLVLNKKYLSDYVKKNHMKSSLLLGIYHVKPNRTPGLSEMVKWWNNSVYLGLEVKYSHHKTSDVNRISYQLYFKKNKTQQNPKVEVHNSLCVKTNKTYVCHHILYNIFNSKK